MRKLPIFFFLSALMLVAFLKTEAQETELGNIETQCATEEEYQLFSMINEYRRINNLEPVPLSRSLSFVARIHARDLILNRPDFGGCNPHSWSDKGIWKPCCYARDENRLACMSEKPRELTSYRAKAWEMVYEGGEEARAMDAFDLWKSIGITRDYLLNTGKWAKPWKALGIAVYGDYAIVWFGEGDDPEKKYTRCLNDSVNLSAPPVAIESEGTQNANQLSDGEKRYYIITGSLNTLEKANREVARLRSSGYSHAKLLPSGNNFRVSADDFASETEAQHAIHAIHVNFPDAWLLKPD